MSDQQRIMEGDRTKFLAQSFEALQRRQRQEDLEFWESLRTEDDSAPFREYIYRASRGVRGRGT